MAYKHDPIEDDPKIKKLVEEAYAEAAALLKKHEDRGGVGFSHILARKVQEILLEKHGIKWKTPQQMNPEIKMD